MHVLVTGSNGFLGRYVMTELAKAGHTGHPFDLHDGCDVQNQDSLRKAANSSRAGHVIHMAGMLGTSELFDTPHEAVDVNVHGSLNVLEVARDHGMGFTGITMPPSPWRNVYVATKHAAVHLAEAWHRKYGVPVSHVRAFNAYGEGQRVGPGHPQKIVPTFSVKAYSGEPIPVWGTGEQTVDLVYAGDLARMLVAAMSYSGCETFDGGTGLALPVNVVAELVCEAAGVSPDIKYLSMRAGETLDTNIVAKGEGWDLLGWHPEFSEDELAATVRSYKP